MPVLLGVLGELCPVCIRFLAPSPESAGLACAVLPEEEEALCLPPFGSLDEDSR